MRPQMKYLAACGIAGIILFCLSGSVQAATKTTWSLFNQAAADADGDGISNWKEINLYHTDKFNKDTDGDGQADLAELMKGTDPNSKNNTILEKHIYVSIQNQELRYYTGPYLMDDFMVSTGIPGKDTPAGEFTVLSKIPVMPYIGPDYYLPNTQWNLMFKPTYYIHGAYWHSNFGHKMSHGCVNVSYTDVKPLYDWADVGTKVTIVNGDFPGELSANFPNDTLLLDSGTIYLVMNGAKHGFTSMAAFSGLGYTVRNLEKRSSTGISNGYVLNNPNMSHVAGSFVKSGQTVYFVDEKGLIPIPTWGIYLSNKGSSNQILTANASDLAKQQLNLMVMNDSRI